MNSGSWTVMCRDFAGRERPLRVLVRGSEVVIAAPPGETAILDPGDAARFRSAVAEATRMADTPGPGAPGRAERLGTASTAEQHLDGLPPAVEGCPALLPYRGGTTTPIPGPATIPHCRAGELG
jgi:hypothetical protein